MTFEEGDRVAQRLNKMKIPGILNNDGDEREACDEHVSLAKKRAPSGSNDPVAQATQQRQLNIDLSGMRSESIDDLRNGREIAAVALEQYYWNECEPDNSQYSSDPSENLMKSLNSDFPSPYAELRVHNAERDGMVQQTQRSRRSQRTAGYDDCLDSTFGSFDSFIDEQSKRHGMFQPLPPQRLMSYEPDATDIAPHETRPEANTHRIVETYGVESRRSSISNGREKKRTTKLGQSQGCTRRKSEESLKHKEPFKDPNDVNCGDYSRAMQQEQKSGNDRFRREQTPFPTALEESEPMGAAFTQSQCPLSRDELPDEDPYFTNNELSEEESNGSITVEPKPRRRGRELTPGPRGPHGASRGPSHSATKQLKRREKAGNPDNAQDLDKSTDTELDYEGPIDGTRFTVQDYIAKATTNIGLRPAIVSKGSAVTHNYGNEKSAYQEGASLIRHIVRDVTKVQKISRRYPSLHPRFKEVADEAGLNEGKVKYKFAPYESTPLVRELSYDGRRPVREVGDAARKMTGRKDMLDREKDIPDHKDQIWTADILRGRFMQVAEPPNPKKRKTIKGVIDVINDMREVTLGGVDSHTSMLVVDEKSLIRDDKICCSNEDRLRVQGEGHSNPDLLTIPTLSCQSTTCKRQHQPWATNGHLIIPGCCHACEVCGLVLSGAAGPLRNHVARFHVGAEFDPGAAKEHRFLYTGVGGGSTTANYPREVQEWAKREGKPPNEYQIPPDHPKYPLYQAGLVNKNGAPTKKAKDQAGGVRSGTRKKKTGSDYLKRNEEFVFYPGMTVAKGSQKAFPQYKPEAVAKGKEEEIEE